MCSMWMSCRSPISDSCGCYLLQDWVQRPDGQSGWRMLKIAIVTHSSTTQLPMIRRIYCNYIHWLHIYIYIYMCVYMYIYIYIFRDTYIIHRFIYLCVCDCIYSYIYFFNIVYIYIYIMYIYIIYIYIYTYHDIWVVLPLGIGNRS